MVSSSKGILDDEKSAHSDPTGLWYQQTPKYDMDSSSHESMARFYIEETLVDAITAMYPGQTTGTILGSLLTKLKTDGGGFIEFLLGNISSSERDRYVISETLGSNFTVFGVGKEPEILTCSGVLKNTKEDNWQVQFLEFFNKVGGVRALGKLYQYNKSTGRSNKNYLTFKYNNRVVQGALLSVSTTLVASMEMDIALTFAFLVTKVVVSPSGNSDTSQISSSSSIGTSTTSSTTTGTALHSSSSQVSGTGTGTGSDVAISNSQMNALTSSGGN